MFILLIQYFLEYIDLFVAASYHNIRIGIGADHIFIVHTRNVVQIFAEIAERSEITRFSNSLIAKIAVGDTGQRCDFTEAQVIIEMTGFFAVCRRIPHIGIARFSVQFRIF